MKATRHLLHEKQVRGIKYAYSVKAKYLKKNSTRNFQIGDTVLYFSEHSNYQKVYKNLKCGVVVGTSSYCVQILPDDSEHHLRRFNINVKRVTFGQKYYL